MEYAGWDAATKVNIPASPADGPKGKKVILIVHGDHPWTTAYINGAKKACEFFGMTLEAWSPNWDVNVQNQLIDQAINARPDAIGLIPLNAESATQQFRKINEAGIPVFGTNTLPTSDAMKYMISWTGPDDWGQMRLLARKLADAMGNKGGICYITHNAGTSPYFARTYGPITEFKKIAPDIKTLDIQTPGFDAVQCKQVVSDWITRFGTDLNAIFLADDSAQAIGTIDAIKEAGRSDILVVAAGNSKAGHGPREERRPARHQLPDRRGRRRGRVLLDGQVVRRPGCARDRLPGAGHHHPRKRGRLLSAAVVIQMASEIRFAAFGCHGNGPIS